MAHDKDDKLRRLPHALLRRSPIIKSTRGPELGGPNAGCEKLDVAPVLDRAALPPHKRL
jgi:hypothetical protein